MELVVSEFSGEVKQAILDRMNREYLATGKFVKDQMSVSPKIMSSLMLSGTAAGTAVSASMSASLFMATVPMSTLMVYKTGLFSSIVLDAGGKIASHAGFIPVAGSLPVVAPLMAMNALNSVAMLHQLDAMDKKLDAIKESIDRLLARQEVTKIAELFAAVHIVDEIYLQYSQAGSFTTDMLIRLALAERDAMILSRRYEMLEDFEVSDPATKGFANYDTFCTILASFLNLRVNYLRTCVDIQENPQFVQRSSENFTMLVQDCIDLWERLLGKSERIKSDIDELVAQMERRTGILRITTNIAKGKELARKKEEWVSALDKERTILKDFHKLIDIAKQMSEAKNEQTLPSLVYWNDSEGEHCIATNELILDNDEITKVP